MNRLRTLLLVLAALIVALPSSAQAPGRVTAIEVQGNQRIEADTIRSYMLVQPGGTADPDALDRSLRALRFWVPQWFKAEYTLAYYDMFAHPQNMPPYQLGELDFWWYDADKAEKLKQSGALR